MLDFYNFDEWQPGEKIIEVVKCVTPLPANRELAPHLWMVKGTVVVKFPAESESHAIFGIK